MKKLIQEFEKQQIEKLNANRAAFPKFKVGDTVSVKYKITEGANTRLQAFQGVVIAKAKNESHYSATFTVRKISSGVGVERKFTFNSPLLAGIEVMKQGVVRRAKLYYLRNLTGKSSRIKEKLDFFVEQNVSEKKVEENSDSSAKKVESKKSAKSKNEAKS